MFCSFSASQNPGWQYYCVTKARCRLCQFPFEDGEHTVADLGTGAMSPWFEFHNEERCSDHKRRITIHMTRADDCPRNVVEGGRVSNRSTPAAPFHAQCFNRRTSDASERFLAATAYWPAPSPAEERRRSSRIQRLLAARLAQLISPSDGFHALHLPGEVWMMVAGLLVRQCAALDAQIRVERQPKVEDSQASLGHAVYASYIKFEGRHYIKTLYNQPEDADGVQIGSYVPRKHFLVVPKYGNLAGSSRSLLVEKSSEHQTKSVGCTENEEKEARSTDRGGVWMAYDHLGVRQIFYVPPDKKDAWNSRFPKVEYCSWRYIPLGTDGLDGSTLSAASDGTKARNITRSWDCIRPGSAPRHKSGLGGASPAMSGFKTILLRSSNEGPLVHWPQPLFPLPTVRVLVTRKGNGPPDNGVLDIRLMRSVNCNVPGTVGYCAAISPADMAPVLIIPHTENTSHDQWELCNQLTSMACQWIYFPLSPGERITDVWGNAHPSFAPDRLVRGKVNTIHSS
ncbi:hypothetical protein RB597_001155 [Gaeumannomyces tritici]